MRCSGTTNEAASRRSDDESNDGGDVQQTTSLASETSGKRDREHSIEEHPDEKSDISPASWIW